MIGIRVGKNRLVAPFAGAWIEISYAHKNPHLPTRVAPFAGAWIEIV